MAGDEGNLIAGMRRTGDAASATVLQRLGIHRDAGGALVVPADALAALQQERARTLTISNVPSTPRNLMRNGGGVGYQRGSGSFGALSFSALRILRDQSPILNPIHAAREHQVRRLARRYSGVPGDVGFRVVHRRYRDPDFDPPVEFERFQRQFEDVLFAPSPRYAPTLGALLVPLMDDLLTINRPAVEVLHSFVEPSRVVGFRPVDGALIWPTLEWIQRWKGQNPHWYRQATLEPDELTEAQVLELASESVGFDLFGAEYCLVRDGSLEAVYRPGAIVVAPVVNRTDILHVGYPPSTVEKAVASILAFQNAWTYNDSFFTKGMMSEFALGLTGNLHPSDMDAIRDMFREATQGVGRAWEVPLIPLPEAGALTKIDLKAPNKDMMYEVWISLLVAFTCANYRMDPTEINAKPWEPGGGGALSERGRGQEIALAKEEGLQSDIEHLAENILTPLAQRCHPDLMVVAEYGGDAPAEQAEVHGRRCAVHVTRNEARLLDGLTPLGFWVPPKELETLSDEKREKFDQNPWNWPTDPGFSSAMSQQAQAKQQAEMMEQQQAQGGDEQPQPDEGDDGFGGPGGDDEDDGFGQQAVKPFGKAVAYVVRSLGSLGRGGR